MGRMSWLMFSSSRAASRSSYVIPVWTHQTRMGPAARLLLPSQQSSPSRP